MVFLTGVLTIATAVLAWYTYHLWDDTKKLVEGADDTAHRQLRAYVAVSGEQHEDTTIEAAAGSKLHASIFFTNMGVTPVYDFVWTASLGVAESPLGKSAPTLPTCTDLWASGAQRHYFGKKVGALERDGEVPGEQKWRAIVAGASAVYLTGRTCYRDIFKMEHRTDFCVFRKMEASGQLGPTLRCPVGNDAD